MFWINNKIISLKEKTYTSVTLAGPAADPPTLTTILVCLNIILTFCIEIISHSRHYWDRIFSIEMHLGCLL